jgi:hypothetical protein
MLINTVYNDRLGQEIFRCAGLRIKYGKTEYLKNGKKFRFLQSRKNQVLHLINISNQPFSHLK